MKKIKRAAISAMAMTMAFGTVFSAYAGAPADGKTEAAQFAEDNGLTSDWESWKTAWENIKNDWTQVSITPGTNETEMNFAWYSKTETAVLKVGQKEDLSDARTINVKGTAIVQDSEGTQYYSCKTAVTKLAAGTYYYKLDDRDTVKFDVRDPENGFSFIFVGDPQIGSSNELKGQDTAEFYQAQSDSVMSDSFNWDYTLKQALNKALDASFVLSAGDQIQTTKKKAPNKDATNSEIEYAGYLSPSVLKSLPVATTVGNHDADNPNYIYHFNTPNMSELGSNGIVGGDYWFTYGDALFMMLNTQDTNVAEHKQFIENAVAENPDCKWRIVTLHQDIYGSAEHSNEPEITNLRYQLIPYFEEYDVDVVLTGHDHAYTRSQILKGGEKTNDYTDDEFDEMLEVDIDAGDDESTRTVALGNIKADTIELVQMKYLEYLGKVMDASAVENVKFSNNTEDNQTVVNPDGILYMTASSSSGSKYYDLTSRQQTYVAARWQEDVPSYSVIDITDTTFTINSYRTDTNEKIDTEFTIVKAEEQDNHENGDNTTPGHENNTNAGSPSVEADSNNAVTSTGSGSTADADNFGVSADAPSKESPKTGDTASAAGFAGMIIIAGAVLAIASKKRVTEE